MRTVVFDLDGTLADTSADLLAAANACFVELGHAAPLGVQDKLTAFLGGRAMLRLGFDRLGVVWGEEDITREYPRLLATYAEVLDRETQLYPGAVQAVQDLRALGFATAICTNKPEGLAVELVKRLGIAPLFGALVGADTFAVRTKTDHDTARAAGVPIVLVSFGPEGHGVARLNPDALLHHYADLPALAQKLIS